MTTQATKNANDNYQHCTGTDYYYKLSFGVKCTDGVYQLALDYQSFWFLDIITSYQFNPKVRREEFQTWKLTRVQKSDRFKVVCEDGNKNHVKTQLVPYSDFKDDELTLWLVNGIIMLPTEY